MDIGKFNSVGQSDSNQRYNVRIKAQDNQFTEIENLKNIYLRSNNGSMVRLDSVVTYEEYMGFATINRYGNLYSAAFDVNPNIATGDAIKIVEEITNEILPPGYSMITTGITKELQKTVSSVVFVFTLAIIMLYMVLASQFNSFLQPLVLMVSVPLAIVGGIFGLYITGFNLNLFSMIGLILLVGLVAKNAILLIDFTNELRGKGQNINEALINACPVRLRPILMTSLTVILSMIPSLFAKGTAGYENNASLSIVVIGGMISSTLLTLIVIPVIYSAVENGLEKRKAKNIS